MTDTKVNVDLLNRYQESVENAVLRQGGGGPYDSGMDQRVAKLEGHMEHVVEDVRVLKADVSTLKTDMAALKRDVAHLPSKGFIVYALVTGLALFGALMTWLSRMGILSPPP